jgi:FtsP/CotA-like multicopper oxidase with cupredoxin domain
MLTQRLQVVRSLLLTLIVLPGLCGVAGAYLSPVNPLAGDGTPAYETPVTIVDNPNYVIGPGDPYPDYLTTPNWAYSPPLRKFVDPLPGVCVPTAANNLCENGNPLSNTADKSITVAIPDIVTYPGSDYYEIELVQYQSKMHSDLPPTTQRGYRQVGFGTDTSGGCTDPVLGQPDACTTADNTLDFSISAAHHLGPIIISQKNRPVRVKFINKLPTGAGGDLFIPVDKTIMGSGEYQIDFDPSSPDQPQAAATSGTFTQNRGLLHLHGGRTPWISDGTPHQWITPAGEVTDYPTGVSVTNVPDMPDPGPGASTYFWTNQQSSRMMFYHDHAWGITRLNVYAGEAAGYLIRDDTENQLLSEGILPVAEVPLVLEDKTFVDAATIGATDPTWKWGTTAPTPNTGDLWWPHVYMPAQNPFDSTGIAPMGRWAYGPYFWPATNNPYQPIDNPYFNSACDVDYDPTPADPLSAADIAANEANIAGYTTVNGVPYCQPPEIPSTPNPSWGAEAFMDTPTVNGTAYPVLNVEPKAYRFRILNANHDRFVNLQLYRADPTVDPNISRFDDPATPMNEAALTTASAALCSTLGGCATATEVRMLPAAPDPNMPPTWPADGREGGIPDWNLVGPDWIMIGSEGGFLPRPVVVPPQPVTWNLDVTTFNAGNVNGGSLILGPAERADVIVDFSAYAGQTLIVYNDAPAPWPALDPHYDYFTGDPDRTDIGGAPTTLPGTGPNVRTIMKIVVGGAATSPSTNISAVNSTGDFSLSLLDQAFAGTLAGSSFSSNNGVFRQGQDPLIVGQGNLNSTGDPAKYEAFPFDGYEYNAYNTIYNTIFPSAYPYWGISRINDTHLRFQMVNPDGTINPTYQDVVMKTKAIQDEQGETFDDYGRMRAGLGIELSNPGAGQVNFIIQTYSDPATEILEQNGIQVWKITHNGVDTHPVHFHLYDVQVLNRVGWDGFIRLPDPTEQGWKDTIRISPLEDTIIALRPVTPMLPFGVPESKRPLNPARPAYASDQTELTQTDPFTGNARLNVNHVENFDWEYVWHCHILSHEENDMMRPQSFQFVEALPDAPTNFVATPNGNQVDLTWTDPTPVDFVTRNNFGNPKNEIGFRIERATGTGSFATIGTALANVTSYSDTTVSPNTSYIYRVVAFNAEGESSATTAGTSGNGMATKIGVWKDGAWYLDANGDGIWQWGVDNYFNFGLPTDHPLMGDWNGDGVVTPGLKRGNMYILSNTNASGNGEIVFWFGLPTDEPIVGDWNGDGIDTICVKRGNMYDISNTNASGNGDIVFWFGLPTDEPIVGDWNGDGIDTIGIKRGNIYTLNNSNSSGNGDFTFGYGFSTDLPIIGDWNGDGIDTIGVFRDGAFLLRNSNTSGYDDLSYYGFGAAGYTPLTGRW